MALNRVLVSNHRSYPEIETSLPDAQVLAYLRGDLRRLERQLTGGDDDHAWKEYGEIQLSSFARKNRNKSKM